MNPLSKDLDITKEIRQINHIDKTKIQIKILKGKDPPKILNTKTIGDKIEIVQESKQY